MKPKRVLLFLVLFSIHFRCLPQSRFADSLKSSLLTAREDTSKIKSLLQLSSYYLNSSTDEARQYGTKALELAMAIHYEQGRALALKNIGISYYFQGNTPAALDYYGQSLHVYDSIGDLEGKARMLSNFGTVYYSNGTDDKALDSYFKSLDIAEQIGDKAGIATSYSNIANVYLNKTATTDKALEFFIKALKISEETRDKNIIGSVAVNLGDIYSSLDKYDSALYYYDKSMHAFTNTINIPYPLRGIGLVYAKKGEFTKAIKYNLQSYEVARQFDSKLAMTQSLLALGDTYLNKGDYASSLASYRGADSIAKIIPALKELDQGYAGLASTYSKLGDFVNAYKYQKLFSGLADTLNNQTLADKLTSLQNNFEIQTRQNKINLLTKDKKLQDLDLESQKLQKTIVSGGLALIFIIALIILRNWIQSSRTNKLLDQQKVQIEGLLENILPTEVAKELQRDGRATPRYYEKVSVLFTDFKDFTKHADTLSPQEIVTELSACFMAFDEIVEKYNLEKIKTIGDSYMAAGGIPTENDTHTLDMVMASLEFQSYMGARNDERRAKGLSPWSLRVGIHVGPVVAGVVGKKKYAYDIWGSTVNIASRMESNGEPGMVNISANTYELVKEYYTCFHRGKIYAKNIGEIDMYFVQEPIGLAGKIQHSELFNEVREPDGNLLA